MGNPIRSPLGAVGALLVTLEAIAGGTLFALDANPGLRIAIVATMIAVIATVTVVILGLIIYVAKTNLAYLFNPAEIGQLSAEAQTQFLLSTQSAPLTLTLPGVELVVGETSGGLDIADFEENQPTDPN